MAGQHYNSVGKSGTLENDLSAESIRAQLAKTLQSRTFSQAPILSRLLCYLVEHAIQGNADQLKEYSLGVDAENPSTLAPTPSFWFMRAGCDRN